MLTNQDKGKILRKKINKQMKHVMSREIKLKMGEKKENWREKKHLKREKTKKHKKMQTYYHFNKRKIDF